MSDIEKRKVKPNRRFKKNFCFCPVSIVFCRGIRISLIMIFTGEDYEKLSLRECFLKKSGEKGFRLARDYEGTCLKLSRIKNHVVFALRCKKSDVVPKGLRVPCQIRTEEGRKIARNAEKNFVPVPFGTKPLPWFVFSISDMVSFLFSSLILHLRKGHTVVSKRHGKKVKPNHRFKKNFCFCPVSIVFCRGIRISLIMIFTGEDYEKLSLRECFLKKSGEKGFRLARDYEGTCLKLSRIKNHVVFALRCKKSDVVPKGLRVPCQIRTEEGRKIARNAEKNFVPVPFGTKPLPWFVFSISDMISFLFSSLILHLRKGHTVVSKRHGKKVKPNHRFK